MSDEMDFMEHVWYTDGFSECRKCGHRWRSSRRESCPKCLIKYLDIKLIDLDHKVSKALANAERSTDMRKTIVRFTSVLLDAITKALAEEDASIAMTHIENLAADYPWIQEHADKLAKGA